MPAAPPAPFQFAIATHAAIDLALITQVIEALRNEFGARLVSAELYGRAEAGEVILVCGFSVGTYAVGWRMNQEAQELKGKLLDLQLLGEEAKTRFESKRLALCEIQISALKDPAKSVELLREQLGLGTAHSSQPLLQVSFPSEEDLWQAYAKFLAEGAFFVPASRVLKPGTELRLHFLVPEREPLGCHAKVVDRQPEGTAVGFFAALTPNQPLNDFLARRASEKRQGRMAVSSGSSREHARFETLLEVEFANYPELSVEYATNISKGGLFVRTRTPPEKLSRVKLRISLPTGEQVDTEAEVVHVLTPEEAKARGTQPGVGLQFRTRNEAFDEPFHRLIQEYQARRPRVLAVDDDAFFRIILKDALTEAGMDVETAADGDEGFRKLIDGLYQLDLLVLDIEMPGLDGLRFMDRVRRIGGECDLRIILLTGKPEAALQELKGPTRANDVISKSTPPGELVARIQRLLGR